MTPQKPQEAHTATITIQYGSESRTVAYAPSANAWGRLMEIESIEHQVGDHLFDLVAKESSANLFKPVVSPPTVP